LARNCRKEFEMAKETSAVAVLTHLRPVLQAAAKNLLHHLSGSEGPAWGTRFEVMEQLVKQLGNYPGTELLQQALQRQADQVVCCGCAAKSATWIRAQKSLPPSPTPWGR
jgi:hypothetical protein